MDTVASVLAEIVAGRSVAGVAWRAKASPLAVARYLAGADLPDTYPPLEAIGNACGANEWQLDRLAEAWYRQTHPPIDARHGGFAFHDNRRGAPGATPDDLYGRVLHAVWLRTDRLVPVAGQAAGAHAALTELHLDRLAADRKLRKAVRAELVPGVGDREYRAALPPDPPALRRQILAATPASYETRAGRALDLIGAALLHPDELLRIEARAGARRRAPAPLAENERSAVLGGVETGPDPRWSGWARATAPADRATVEAGIRRCYVLAGFAEPASIVWTDSPHTGVLLRRLADPLYVHHGPALYVHSADPRRGARPTVTLHSGDAQPRSTIGATANGPAWCAGPTAPSWPPGPDPAYRRRLSAPSSPRPAW